MKTVLSILAVSAMLASSASAQLFGTITDSPSHAFAIGGGFDPSTHEGSAFFGYAEKISNATYSYSRAEFIPSFTTVPAPLGSSANQTTATTVTNFTVRPVVSTGIKQIVYQEGRFSLAVDGAAGAALPTAGTSAFNMAFTGGADLIMRLNKTLNTDKGKTNNYIVFGPSLVQLTGTQGGTTIAMRIAWLHSVN